MLPMQTNSTDVMTFCSGASRRSLAMSISVSLIAGLFPWTFDAILSIRQEAML
jgi:hypothetical protein